MVYIEDSKQFEELVSEGVTLIDFYATWCGPCRMLSPIIEEIDAEFGEKIKIAKLDVDECSDVARKFGINAIPAILVFKDGELKKNNVGFMPKDAIVNFINEVLSE